MGTGYLLMQGAFTCLPSVSYADLVDFRSYRADSRANIRGE